MEDNKLKMHTPNLAQEKFLILSSMFPNAVTESIMGYDEKGKAIINRTIDPNILNQEINNNVVPGIQERYQFTWPDKNKAILVSNSPVTSTLRPFPNESVNFEETKNLYIEGDNLDVLKTIRETYLNKVKTIFIDPPYNTGTDFIYEDNFNEDTNEFFIRDNQYDDQGNRLTTNLNSNGRYHTDWLNMIYPRLRVARDLLTDDGSIFVSIDYNEFANMKKILDEIFGEENFQREIIWRIGWLSGYKTTAPNFIRNHDTILMYSKNHNSFDFKKKYIMNKDFKPLVKEDAKIRKKLSELGLDRNKQKELLNFINHENRPEKYPIEDTWNSNEYDDLNSIAIVSFSGEKVSKILNIDQDFKGQKSVKMLKRILEATTSEDDIVMDFFSGSGSTAHAVMQLNAEDGFNRQYIMVQIPEPIDQKSEAYKRGYTNICEIGKERLRRVGEKINSELKNRSIDYGFRVLKLDSSNMKDVYYKPEDYLNPEMKMDDLIDNIKNDRNSEDLLFQVLLDLGIELSSKIEKKEYYYVVDENYLIASFEYLNTEKLKEIAKKQPKYAVFKNSSFKNDNDLINLEQVFNTYSPNTVRRVL